MYGMHIFIPTHKSIPAAISVFQKGSPIEHICNLYHFRNLYKSALYSRVDFIPLVTFALGRSFTKLIKEKFIKFFHHIESI